MRVLLWLAVRPLLSDGCPEGIPLDTVVLSNVNIYVRKYVIIQVWVQENPVIMMPDKPK